jgi:hypothetical protein
MIRAAMPVRMVSISLGRPARFHCCAENGGRKVDALSWKNRSLDPCWRFQMGPRECNLQMGRSYSLGNE